MSDHDFPRTIAAEDVQVGDRIRIEPLGNDSAEGIVFSETLTVARIEDGYVYTPSGALTRIGNRDTVTLLDRPEPEPDWVADGICVDQHNDPWMLRNGEWRRLDLVGRGWSDLPKHFGPISRHPAVIAAEKRGEQRVLDAVGLPRVINGDAS